MNRRPIPQRLVQVHRDSQPALLQPDIFLLGFEQAALGLQRLQVVRHPARIAPAASRWRSRSASRTLRCASIWSRSASRRQGVGHVAEPPGCCPRTAPPRCACGFRPATGWLGCARREDWQRQARREGPAPVPPLNRSKRPAVVPMSVVSCTDGKNAARRADVGVGRAQRLFHLAQVGAARRQLGRQAGRQRLGDLAFERRCIDADRQGEVACQQAQRMPRQAGLAGQLGACGARAFHQHARCAGRWRSRARRRSGAGPAERGPLAQRQRVVGQARLFGQGTLNLK